MFRQDETSPSRPARCAGRVPRPASLCARDDHAPARAVRRTGIPAAPNVYFDFTRRKAAITIPNAPEPASASPATRDTGRERVGRAAYELFSKDGVRAVGVDAIIAHAGTAKMTLYRNFPSKDDLIIDFLQRRERLWTREWLEAESQRRGVTPRQQLLAIFDVLDRKSTRLNSSH